MGSFHYCIHYCNINNMTKQKSYNTLNQMNKPIRMMGLSSIQLFIIIGVVGMTVMICTAIIGLNVLSTIMVAGVVILPLVFIAGKLSVAHKKGCPDYMKSYLAFMSTPKKIIDRKRLLSIIYQEPKT